MLSFSRCSLGVGLDASMNAQAGRDMSQFSKPWTCQAGNMSALFLLRLTDMNFRFSSRLFALSALGCLALISARAQDAPDIAAALQEGAYVAHQYTTTAIRWSACPQAATIECGTLTLPIDYRRPHSGTFDMAVMRARSANQGRRNGPLVITHGGPSGASAIDATLAQLDQPNVQRLRARFDIVTFDQRGTGRSRPVRCDVKAVGRPPEGASDDSLASFFDDFGRNLASACVEQNGAFLTSVSTNNVARDLDVLRRALGERQISFYGPSYSSMVGAAYASLFPHHVRAMVLDGVRAPETRDYVMETISETFASTELALHRVDQLCRASATCLLRTAGVVATMDKVLARLRAAPVVYPDGRVLDVPAFRGLIDEALGVENRWPEVVLALEAAGAGRFGPFQGFLPLPGSLAVAGLGAGMLQATRFEALAAVSCVDYGTRRSAASTLPFDAAFASLNSRVVTRFDVAATTAMCSAWPAVDAPVFTRLSGRVANPVLMIGNQFDNRTPISWVQSMARSLGMERSLIRYEGGGHTAYTARPGQRIACIDQVVEAYLLDLRVPAEGFFCAAQRVNL